MQITFFGNKLNDLRRDMNFQKTHPFGHSILFTVYFISKCRTSSLRHTQKNTQNKLKSGRKLTQLVSGIFNFLHVLRSHLFNIGKQQAVYLLFVRSISWNIWHGTKRIIISLKMQQDFNKEWFRFVCAYQISGYIARDLVELLDSAACKSKNSFGCQ